MTDPMDDPGHEADHSEDPSASLEIRRAAETDVRPIAELWSQAFPGRRTIADRIRMLESGGRYGGIETVLVARTGDGRLAGACKIYRMEQHIAGVAMPMMALAAVAVPTSFRRRGIGSRLCREAIHAAVERGDVLSVLYPFRPDFYRRLGWGLVGQLHEYRFHTAALPPYPADPRVREAGEADAGPIAACYRRIAERSNGPVSRDHTVWTYRLSGEDLGVRPVDAGTVWADDGNRGAIVVEHGGAVAGYALLRTAAGSDGRGRLLDVRELLAETEEAYRALWGYIAARRERWPRARHFARVEERFGERLIDPRPPGHRSVRSLYFPTARVARGPMLRVLDTAAALRSRRWFDRDPEGGRGGSIGITIRDPERPDNDGPWLVRLGADAGDGAGDGAARTRGSVERGGPGAGEVSASIETDAATFARIFAGEVPPTEAARLGHAKVGGAGPFVDDAFATRDRFWLFDEF